MRGTPQTTVAFDDTAVAGFLVQFVLPKGMTVANAPEPLDERIQLREVLFMRRNEIWLRLTGHP